MFDKILIANRGEIACRIIRTAKCLGITTVAVYSEADSDALHVQQADEAWCVGPAKSSQSYLRGDKILEIAAASGVQAIHPGYGFLSENAEFARACEQAGLVFIGPPADVIEVMGSKSRARQLMASAGVPLIPGYDGEDQSDARLAKESKRIGYPQLIKPSAGGGGKGMYIVHEKTGFKGALASARRQAQASFGDERILIEHYLKAARHVEVQIFADSQTNLVHLFERDCSIQRRHQKIIEEAPAPGVSSQLRAKMAKAALACARAVGYVGAGTIEFLLNTNGQFYFIEMNTRLQVEHAVTEMITGIDLVQWQLEVAAGLPLALTQEQIKLSGHAIEARVYAEMPERDFLPAAGKLQYCQTPTCGSDIRIDTGIKADDDIGTDYDPMMAKLIVHADDRRIALKKMQTALSDYQILGVPTNLALLASIISNPDFVTANFDTEFIEKHRDEIFADRDVTPEIAVVLAGLVLISSWQSDVRSRSDDNQSPWQLANGWRLNQPAQHRIYLYSRDSTYRIDLVAGDKNWCLRTASKEYQVIRNHLDKNCFVAEIDARRYEVAATIDNDSVQIWYQHKQWCFQGSDPGQANNLDLVDKRLVAPMPGKLVAVQVKQGDRVQAGDSLMVIEAMKMEHTIVAPVDTSVSEVLFEVGDQVTQGDQLIWLE